MASIEQSGQQRNCVSVISRGKVFFFLSWKASELPLGPIQTHIQWMTGLNGRGTRQGTQLDGEKGETKWSSSSRVPYTYLCGVYTASFTVTFTLTFKNCILPTLCIYVF
jgi:hypothetical protein